MDKKTRFMKLADIKIRKAFLETTPNEEKMAECRKFWEMCNKQDRYVVVNKKGYLIDGYVQYLILKENGVEDVEVRVGSNKKKRWNRRSLKSLSCVGYKEQNTTYIYGIHPRDKFKIERVWRVPNTWIGWESDLLPGDRIIVSTKNGFAPIIITKIEWLDKPPVDCPVKRVVAKCFDYDTTNAKINSLLDKIMNSVYQIEGNCEEKQGVEDYRIYDDIAEIEETVENLRRIM